MQADVLFARLEQFSHLGLSKPDGFFVEPHFEAGPPIFRLVKQQARILFGNLAQGWLSGRNWRPELLSGFIGG